MSWRGRALISQSGMFGVVALALAVALQDLTGEATADGHVEAIIAVACIVTVGALLQGFSLLTLIKGPKSTATDESANDQREIATMQQASKRAGLAYPEKQQERRARPYGPEDVAAFNCFSLGLPRIEHGAE